MFNKEVKNECGEGSSFNLLTGKNHLEFRTIFPKNVEMLNLILQ